MPVALLATSLTRFVVLAPDRSGSSVVVNALDALPGVRCPLNLFHDSVELREKSHKDRFPANANWQGAWNPQELSLDKYLNHVVFAQQPGVEATGCRLGYASIERYDFLAEVQRLQRHKNGIRILHLVRNPVECWLSVELAKRTGRWEAPAIQAQKPCFMKGFPDPEELTQYCRWHIAWNRRIADLGRNNNDVLCIAYEALKNDYVATMRRVMKFLGLPGRPAKPRTAKLRHDLPFRERIARIDDLMRQVPSDIQDLLRTAA
jgi:LPS sulfotransferase NodH